VITLIADDLTGACDAGALYAGRGRVPVFVGEIPIGDEPDVAVVDTESRALAPAAAADRVATTARRLGARARQSVLFKKIDSTLRGPVAAELDSLLSSTGHRTAIVCPAFPEQARTVVDGILRIGALPAHESPIGRDPAYGGRTSSVVDIMGRGSRRPVLHWPLARLRGNRDALTRDLEAADHVIVADAECDSDLDTIAEIALSRPSILLSGSAGLARAVAGSRGYPNARVPLPEGRVWLIVAGSLQPATRAQARALELAGVLCVRLNGRDPETGPLVARLESGHPVLITTADQIAAAQSVSTASRLGSLAATVLARSRPDLVVVTGGETAVALLRAVGTNTIDLLGVPASGLALGELSIGAASSVPLLTKAGGFGAPDLLVNLLKGTP
jgi:uncharacterized protein YgbK (DUF1537 family)